MTTAIFPAPAAIKPSTKTAGYSLVELVSVILILGVLLAVTLPRMFEIHTEARRAEVAGTAAAFESAVHLAYASCVVRNFAELDNLPNYGAGDVDFNVYCLPSSTSGNNNLNMNGPRCMQVWNGMLSPAPSISVAGKDDTKYRAQAKGSTCTYTYRNDTDITRSFTYDSATGAISVSNP